MTDFRKALVFTGIPHALVAVAIGVLLALLNPDLAETDGFTVVDIAFYIDFGLVAAAVIAWGILRRRGKQEIARGIKWGTGGGIALMLVLFIVASLLVEG